MKPSSATPPRIDLVKLIAAFEKAVEESTHKLSTPANYFHVEALRERLIKSFYPEMAKPEDSFARSEIAMPMPSNWAMVPQEPTEAMLDATKEAFSQINDWCAEMQIARGRKPNWDPSDPPMKKAWRAMLAAAPSAPLSATPRNNVLAPGERSSGEIAGYRNDDAPLARDVQTRPTSQERVSNPVEDTISSQSDKPQGRSERDLFEAWLAATYDSDAEFDEARNCYKEFPVHMAWQAFRGARTLPSATATPLVDAARDALRRYIWNAQHPRAPIAGSASLDAAMVKLRDAFVAAGEPDYNNVPLEYVPREVKDG